MAKSAKKSKIVIRIEDMHKWYGQFHALKAINLEVTQGERIVICGPSGSGKSTLIRCINRLEVHQTGIISIKIWLLKLRSYHTFPFFRLIFHCITPRLIFIFNIFNELSIIHFNLVSLFEAINGPIKGMCHRLTILIP